MPVAPGLNDSFTEEGFWWPAGDEEASVGGTLTFDPATGSELRLLGILGDDLVSAFNNRGSARTTIHGVTKKGRPVTLLNALQKQQQLNMPGIANETWTSNLLVIGIHLSSEKDEEIFSKSYFRFEAIDQWLESRPFTYAVDDEPSVTVKATKERETHFASHKDFEVTTVASIYSSNTPKTRYTIDVFSQLAITPSSPKSLNWHLARARRLQELAALCTGHYLPLTAMELRGPNETIGEYTKAVEAHFYAQLIHTEVGQRPAHEAPLLSGRELITINDQAVQEWFDQYDVFEPAIALFFTITGQKHMFTNIRLLLAIQALEVFHRRTARDTVMPDAEFPEFVEALTDAIPSPANQAMREKLKGTYQFLNELSLSQRLKAIESALSDAFGTKPPAFDKNYIRKLVNTRNYYTHFSETLRGETLDSAEMYWASRRIILLLTLLFLLRIGLPASRIMPLLDRHQEFSRLWANPGVPQW